MSANDPIQGVMTDLLRLFELRALYLITEYSSTPESHAEQDLISFSLAFGGKKIEEIKNNYKGVLSHNDKAAELMRFVLGGIKETLEDILSNPVEDADLVTRRLRDLFPDF